MYLRKQQPTKESPMNNYSAQINAFGNVIVCKGTVVRNSYRIIFIGSYNECLSYKVK